MDIARLLVLVVLLVAGLVVSRTAAERSATVVRTEMSLEGRAGMGAFARPSFRVPMRRRDGTIAGFLILEGLAGGTADSYVRTDRTTVGGWILLRPGTCFGQLPPPNRSVHPYLGGDGELPLNYQRLRHTYFAVEIVGDDGRTRACGYHTGAYALPAYDRGVHATGRARWRGGTLHWAHKGLSLSVAPVANGRRTRVRAGGFGESGSNPSLAHVLRGTCAKVGPGREWPMTIPTPVEAGYGTATFALSFAEIRRHPFAFEVHSDIGAEVYDCIDLPAAG